MSVSFISVISLKPPTSRREKGLETAQTSTAGVLISAYQGLRKPTYSRSRSVSLIIQKSVGFDYFSDMSDIRKWFMKQPHKNNAGEVKTPNQEVKTPNQEHGSEGANTGRKKVSKYFSSTTPDKTVKPTPEQENKTEKVSLKRKNQTLVEGNVSGIKVPSPKKIRKDNRKEAEEKDQIPDRKVGSKPEEGPTGSTLENQTGSLPQHVGRGGGGGRGGGSGSGGGGRGRGGGRGAYGNFGDRGPPPHRGQKEVPQGAEDCLAGLTFVISGTLDSLEREEAEDLIKSHGGRITGSVSKKTNYLLVDEDIGGRKSQKAIELGITFLSEDALFDMIRKSKPSKPSDKENLQKKEQKDSKESQTKLDTDTVIKIQDKANQGQIGKAYGGKGGNKGVQSEVSHKKNIKNIKGDTLMWTEKYRPKTPDDIIGNQSIVKNIHDWLAHWDEQHLHTEGKEGKGKKRGGGSVSSNVSKKAVLLSGTPGIGKTTSARLISQMLGFETIEVNASDSRGKADSKIERGMAGSTANSIKEMVSNESLSRGSFMDGSKRGKSVLIMDEVDGMSGGDRGGVSDLIASIKISKIPIICICNDRYNQKLKSLVNYCLPLNFRKPTKQQMAKRLSQVAGLEGLKVDEAALLELGERVNGDMRMALNQLQYMSLSSSILKYGDIKARLQGSKKDEDVTPFTAVDKLLGYEGGRLRMDERMDLCMSDPDLVPLLIQENYLNYKPSAANRDGNGSLRMDLIARAAESIADGDIINVQIRRYRQWQHSQMGAFASSIIPAALMHGPREVLVQGERNFNRFGGWLGKNSTLGKNTRLLEDVHVHFLASGTCEPTREALRLDYLPLLLLRLTRPLQALPKEEAVQTVVEFMNEYSLNQEDFDTIVELSKFQDHPDPLDGIQPAVKSALTKAYKQNEHRVRSADLLPAILLPGQKKIPKSKRVASLLTTVDEYPLENREDEPAEGEQDSSDEDDFEASAQDGNLQLSLEDNKSKGIEIQLDIKNKGNANANPSKAKQSKARAEKATATKGAKRKR